MTPFLSAFLLIPLLSLSVFQVAQGSLLIGSPLGQERRRLFYAFLKRNIPMSGGQASLTGTKKVPTPLVIKVQRRFVSLMSPDGALYFGEQGIHGAQLMNGILIWPP